jgi:hypothetical protein
MSLYCRIGETVQSSESISSSINKTHFIVLVWYHYSSVLSVIGCLYSIGKAAGVTIHVAPAVEIMNSNIMLA